MDDPKNCDIITRIMPLPCAHTSRADSRVFIHQDEAVTGAGDDGDGGDCDRSRGWRTSFSDSSKGFDRRLESHHLNCRADGQLGWDVESESRPGSEADILSRLDIYLDVYIS